MKMKEIRVRKSRTGENTKFDRLSSISSKTSNYCTLLLLRMREIFVAFDMTSLCEVCSKSAAKVCSACKNVSYCSVEHQKKDWKRHKSTCKPYIVKRNDVLGRYIVASRDISPGTVIIDEPAVMVGPKQDTLPICLGCHKRLKGTSYLCSKCRFPMCCEECEKQPIHAEYECTVFGKKKRDLQINNVSEHLPIYECIFTIRCLLLKEKDLKRWEKMQTMEHHNSLREKMTHLWHRNEVNVVRFLREIYGLEFDPMIIHSVIGYADINAFEIKAEGIEIQGLFPEVALMAHDCISNTHHSITETSRMIVRTTVPVKKGELLTTTYTHTLDGTLQRREHIMDAKLFACQCQRCSSPSELGTHLSSLKCTRCDPGYILSKNSLDAESVWECDNCHQTLEVEKVKGLLEKVKGKIDQIENDRQRNPIPRLEELLQTYSDKLLHSKHFLLLGVLHSLSQFYGKIKDFEMDRLTLEQLQRKEDVCRQLLAVLEVLEPGMSRIRGLTLYELHAAIYFAAQQKFRTGLISKPELRQELETVLDLLATSKVILDFDSVSSSTGRIAQTIPTSMDAVRKIMNHVCS